MYRLFVAVAFMALGLGIAHGEVSIDPQTQKALEAIAAGNRNGDASQMQSGEKMLEALANKGNPAATWNLSAYHHFDLPLKPRSEEKKCFWGLKAANLKVVEAYPAAYLCSANKGRDKADSFANYQVPWARKLATESDDPEERTMGRQIVEAYEAAKRENAGNRTTTTLGELANRFNKLVDARK
jgi:hypothetical protein